MPEKKHSDIMLRLFLAMIGIGLLLGAVYPFYAGLFLEWKSGREIMFVLGSATMGLIGGALIYFIVKKVVVNPLHKLRESTAKIAQGNLHEKLEYSGEDEIGKIAESFNMMVENLRNLLRQIQSTSTKISSTAHNLAASSQELNASTEEITSTAEQISQGAQNQALMIEKTLGIMRELSASIEQIASSAELASKTSEKARENAERGGEASKEVIAKMEHIKGSVQNTFYTVRALNERAEQIGIIVDVITNIAEQTNLLALNAAIEAARAGEHGKGFAVVAEEVRKLADGSKKAAGQIIRLVNEITSESEKAVKLLEIETKEVKEGGEILNETVKALESIIKSFEETAGSIKEIARTTKIQAENVREVVASVEEIASIADENAASTQEASAATQQQSATMDELAASAQELSMEAERLDNYLRKFKLDEVIDDEGRD